MKIPSFKKIELQVDEYMRDNRGAPDEKILTLEKKISRIQANWLKLRDVFCFADEPKKCICATHPRYQEIMDKLSPLQAELKNLYNEERNKTENLRKKKRKELILARHAKIKWLDQRKKDLPEE
jgi:hypothetical protein